MTRFATTLAAAVAALCASLVAADTSAGSAAAGKTLYDINCMTCHGTTGKGDGPVGIALNPRPRDFSTGDFVFDPTKDGKKGTDEDLVMVIKNGAAAYGGSPLMAPWPILSDADVQNLIAYIRALKQ
jgi:mono/diheme cytochrome c family protein